MRTLIVAVIVLVLIIAFAWKMFISPPDLEETPSQIIPEKSLGTESTTNGELVRHSNPYLDRWIRSAPLYTFSEIVRRYYWAADAPVREFLRKKGWKSA